MHLNVYTDGSSRKNGAFWVGTYAFAVYENDKSTPFHVESKAMKNATNNIAELMAAIAAINYINHHYPLASITIYTDSNYLLTGVKKSSGHKTNTQVWAIMTRLLQNRKAPIQFEKVPAHSSNIGNNQVDSLARKTLRSLF